MEMISVPHIMMIYPGKKLIHPRLVTVATSLFKFTGPLGNQYNYICAGVIITMIPALIVFILCQKQIYGGLAAGAVKG